MSLLVTVTGPRDLADIYDGVIKELDASGLGRPEGRTSHVAAIDADGLTVVDLWESAEQFEAFAAQLGPVIEKLGGPAPTVVVRPVHNTLH